MIGSCQSDYFLGAKLTNLMKFQMKVNKLFLCKTENKMSLGME